MFPMSFPPSGVFWAKNMSIRIATPYSHLFDSADLKRTILGLSDVTEIRGPDQVYDITHPVLWHCDLSLVRKWADKHLFYLSSIVDGFRSANVRLDVASFHVPSRYQVNDVMDGAFIGRGEPMCEDEMLANASANATTVRNMLNQAGLSDVQLLVENNNHLGSDAYDTVTAPAFINRLLDLTDFGLLLDVAHARITAANTAQDERAYFEKLPLGRAVQIHLSRHSLLDGRARDSHDALEDDDWDFFHGLMSQLPRLAYATIEFYKDANVLTGLLKRLRKELEVYEGWRGETV